MQLSTSTVPLRESRGNSKNVHSYTGGPVHFPVFLKPELKNYISQMSVLPHIDEPRAQNYISQMSVLPHVDEPRA